MSTHSPPDGHGAAVSVEPIATSGHFGEVAGGRLDAGLGARLDGLLDPGSAEKTIHWGRNYLWVASWPARGGSRRVVVKQFRNESLRRRLDRRLRGSRAARSWRVAQALARAGFHTPEPLAWIESREPSGPSYYVSAYLADLLEARYYLRSLNAGSVREDHPRLAPDAFFQAVASTARRLHDAGFWFRDFSVGNLLLDLDEVDPPTVHLVDLNRCRQVERLGTWRRMRDLCRLPLDDPEDGRRLLVAYWGRRPSLLARLAYAAASLGFHGRARVKRALRGLAGRSRRIGPRTSYPHLPPPPEGSRRDRVVWDRLSDQPHQHANRADKLLVRLGDLGAHVRTAAIVCRSTPAIWSRYRTLTRSRPEPALDGIGCCVRPLPEAPEALLAAIDDLGVRHLLLRLHPWQEDHSAEEELAAALSARGLGLCFSLPQSRELVRDPGRWRRSVAELGERFGRFGSEFQIGQAINRSKWGVWTLDEYAGLARVAAEALEESCPGATLAGPAVIDFEPHQTIAAVNWPRGEVRFDVLASLLYVDRRGAPERRQLGFDAAGKTILLQAIADTGALVGSRCWITEVNWPLREGPHSPAGRDVAVDEETAARYLARYYLLTLGTGCVERVYWWQLAARGYGLAVLEDEGLRRRPAFHALATLQRTLGGATLVARLDTERGIFAYQFDENGEAWVAAWSAAGPSTVELPARALRLVSLTGDELDPPTGTRLEIDGAVRYARLETARPE